MIIGSLFRIVEVSLKSLWLHKLRSGLTMLGMIIGVGAVIALVAVGEGASFDAQERIKSLGAQNVIIRSVKPLTQKEQLQGEGMEWEARFGLSNVDAAHIQRTVPGVKKVLPILLQRKNVRHGIREVDSQLIGTFPYYPDFTKSKVVRGRFLCQVDETTKAHACVLSVELANRLFAGHNPLKEFVVVRGFESSQVMRVVGILQERADAEKMPHASNIMGQTIGANVYIPLSTFKALYGTKNIDRSVGAIKVEIVDLTEIRVEFGSPEEVIAAIPRLRDALDKRRNGEVDYEIRVPLNELNALREQKARDTRVLMFIACISLLVGGIGIMNIMLATVTERTNEIGVRRALGATRNNIIVQFLIETLMLCLIGGTIGVFGGWGFAELREFLTHDTTIVKVWSIALAFGLSVMVGIIFGLYPALRAAYLDPIEALRHS
jgi:putative ABC transport system permease protein